MQEDELTPAERELEAALASLAPSPARIDPLAAAFRAGARSTQLRMRLWQGAAAAMVAIAVGSWVMPLDRAAHVSPAVVVTVPRNVTIAVTPPPPPTPAPSSQSLLMLQQAVSEKGVSGLPPTEIPTLQGLNLSDFM